MSKDDISGFRAEVGRSERELIAVLSHHVGVHCPNSNCGQWALGTILASST